MYVSQLPACAPPAHARGGCPLTVVYSAPRSPGEGQSGRPRMRWVVMHAQHLQRLRPGAPRRAAHGTAAQPGGAHATATRSLQQPSRRGAAPR